jgi:hypothetical protein
MSPVSFCNCVAVGLNECHHPRMRAVCDVLGLEYVEHPKHRHVFYVNRNDDALPLRHLQALRDVIEFMG